jgi:SAM-dependent methyltransferase
MQLPVNVERLDRVGDDADALLGWLQEGAGMSESDAVFAGSIPDVYDGYLVPLISEGFADDLVGRIASADPQSVLETAAGTGVLTRALAKRLAGGARLTATDLNQPMLDRAAGRQGPDDRISWQQADAQALPFEDGAFDAVCCQFGVMFFPDRVSAYREARRVLKPVGRFLFNTWDRVEDNVFADLVTQAAREMFPGDPPNFLPRTPHGYCDGALICEELEAAGFHGVAIETVTDVSRAPTPRHAAIAFCQGTPLRNEIEAQGTGLLDAVTDRAANHIAAHHGEGEVSAKIQGHVISALA